jgi:hypothetical protein
MLDARIVVARIQGRAGTLHGVSAAALRMAPSSQAETVARLIFHLCRDLIGNPIPTRALVRFIRWQVRKVRNMFMILVLMIPARRERPMLLK